MQGDLHLDGRSLSNAPLMEDTGLPDQIIIPEEACRYYTIESAFSLTVAFLINISVISVSGAVCSSSNLNPEDQMSCKDLDLNKASFLLKNVLGSWSSKLFAIASLASGQSSTITGTYAGLYVMIIQECKYLEWVILEKGLS